MKLSEEQVLNARTWAQIKKLQKRLAAAGSGSDRTRIESKLDRLSRTSPGQPLAKA